MEWRFAKMDRNESRDRSCLAEFFNDSKIFKDFTDALVREDIQNRLDAKRADAADSDPVVVTYRLTTHDAQAASKIKRWLVALAPHCNSNSCRETYHRKPLTCFYESNPTFHCPWLRFTAQLVELGNLTEESTDAEKEAVIDLAVKTYCERLNMLSIGGEEAAE